MGDTAIRFNTAAAEQVIAERTALRTTGSRVRRWLFSAAWSFGCFAVLLPLSLGEGSAAFNPGGRVLWINLAAGLVATLVSIAMDVRRVRRTSNDPTVVAADLASMYDEFAGPGWPWRTLRWGVYLGLGVGIPIGLLFLLLPLPDMTGPREHAQAALGFLALTFCWTIPIVFVFRWVVLRPFRRFLEPSKR